MRRRRKRAIFVATAVVLGAVVVTARAFRGTRGGFFPTRGTVRYVIDGDSFYLTNSLDVRMLELDSPEMKGASPELARRAREAVMKLIGRREVRMERGPRAKDRYGRFLAYVFVTVEDARDDEDGSPPREVFVNAEIVRLGLARARTWGAPGARWDEVLAAEDEAREAKRGMWADAAAAGR